MGSLLINTDSFFKLCNVTSENRDRTVSDFIKGGIAAREQYDNIYQDKVLGEMKFPFGNYYNDFVFAPWNNFSQTACFNGIKFITYQELSHFHYENPNGGKIFDSKSDFEECFTGQHYGFWGLSLDNSVSPIVSCYDTLHEWHIDFKIRNRNLIRWEKADACSLPNRGYSNFFLSKMMDKRILPNELKRIDELSKSYCDTFPQLGLNSNEKRAKAREVGQIIARRNYYTENKKLSAAESILRGSERLIFESSRDGNSIYISLDFEKCFCYELCDHKGGHLGEYRFDGLANGKQDKSGNHDIWTLSR